MHIASIARYEEGAAPAAYSIAKAGSLHLSRIAAPELDQQRMRVNSVSPELLNTGIFAVDNSTAERSDEIAELVAKLGPRAQPMAHAGLAEDFAKVRYFQLDTRNTHDVGDVIGRVAEIAAKCVICRGGLAAFRRCYSAFQPFLRISGAPILWLRTVGRRLGGRSCRPDWISQREFGLRAGNANGADEEAIAVFLVDKDIVRPWRGSRTLPHWRAPCARASACPRACGDGSGF